LPTSGETVLARPPQAGRHLSSRDCGGRHTIELQWQTVAAAKAKDRWEGRVVQA